MIDNVTHLGPILIVAGFLFAIVTAVVLEVKFGRTVLAVIGALIGFAIGVAGGVVSGNEHEAAVAARMAELTEAREVTQAAWDEQVEETQEWLSDGFGIDADKKSVERLLTENPVAVTLDGVTVEVHVTRDLNGDPVLFNDTVNAAVIPSN